MSVRAAAERLLRGEVVAYPTETVYGLGVDATDPAALADLFRLKGRSADAGVSVLVRDCAQLEALAGDLPEAARRLARRFWPGPLTLVVDARSDALAPVRTADGVGFRCSPHPTASSLVRAAGRPVVATSCNRSGAPPCTSAKEVAESFGDELAVAGGEPAGGSPPSTVVAISAQGDLRVLREGAIPVRALEEELAG